MKKKIDKKLLYLLPSILALALSLTVFVFSCGNLIFDLQNTCYRIYVSVPDGWDDEKCMENINQILEEDGTNGFTVMKTAEGGRLTENGQVVLEDSYQILLMKISKTGAERIAQDLYEAFEEKGVMIESEIVNTTFVTGAQK